jgi:hypothetical protein
LRYYGIPVYDSLDVACKCMGVLAEYGAYLKSYHAKANYFYLDWGKKATDAGRAVIAQARAEGRRALLEHEAKKLLAIPWAFCPGPLATIGRRSRGVRPAEINGRGGDEDRLARHPSQERCRR